MLLAEEQGPPQRARDAAAVGRSGGQLARSAAAAAGAAALPAAALSLPPPLAGPGCGPGWPWPARSSSAYQACYCEENVYLLARTLLEAEDVGSGGELYVVFVSNHLKTVPLWRQRAAASPGVPVVWDYHVFAVLRQGGGQPALVFDLDCTLEPFPCTLEEYRQQVLLGSCRELPPQYRRCYRVIPAPLFLHHFASDRSHMRDGADGWLQPPPSWPLIAGAAAATAAVHGGATAHTLPAYLDFAPPEQLDESCAEETGSSVVGDAEAGSREQHGQRQQQPAWLGALLDEPAFLKFWGAQ